MIVPMKKLAILVSSTDCAAALQKVGKLGVVHVDVVPVPPTEDIRLLEAEQAKLSAAERVIGQEADEKPVEKWITPDFVDHILALANRRDALSQELEELSEKLRWYHDWGDISPASIAKLEAAGIAVRFYTLDRRALRELPEDRLVHVVSEEEGTARVALICRTGDEKLWHREDAIPAEDRAFLQSRADETGHQIEAIDAELHELGGARQALATYRADLDRRLEFHRVHQSMGVEGRISYLEGYCPADSLADVEAAAGGEGWACLAEEPDDPDRVPVLVRRPRWLGPVAPVFDFMGTVPGYLEHDIGFLFLLFFSGFFALLIGDGGYGVIFLVATAYMSRKFKEAPRAPFHLLYILSLSTIAWGAASGTWFGYQGIYEVPVLGDLVVAPQIASFQPPGLDEPVDSQGFMMYLCFIIGAVHLTLAHLTVAARHVAHRSPKALGEVGWIVILWSLYFLANNLVLGRELPELVPTALGGVLLVLLFQNFQKNVAKGALQTLGDLPLRLISSFSDIVSYLRLFAVGYASVVVASSFNGMAAPLFGGVLSGFVGAVVLFLGHGLNIILGAMAVIVHGIRLNMLEFSGHLGMQWSGKPYKPFKA